MKIPLRLPCRNCGLSEPVEILLDASDAEWLCPKCKEQNIGFFELDFTIGYKILARSEYECNARKDYPMAIVFSATAFECELSRLYKKWIDIATLMAGSDPDDSLTDEMLRKLGNIKERIEAVALLLDNTGLDAFVSNHPVLREAIEDRFPSLHLCSLAEDFQKSLFWPRNRILHNGFTKFTAEDASRCYSIAHLGLYLFNEMDHARRKALRS